MLYKFDSEKPTIYRDSNNKDRIKFVNPEDNDRWAKSKNMFIYASDKNGSGLSRIYIGREKCSKMLEDTSLGRPAIPGIIQVYEVKIETGRNVDEEYNVCVMDKAGNIAQSKTKVRYVDITPPRCDHTDPDLGDLDAPIIMSNWVRPDRTIRTYCADDHYITEDGVERHLYGSGCVYDYYDKTYSPTTINGTTEITDNVGWTTTCEYRVLVDKTPPICGWSEGESTEWQQEDRTIKQHYYDEHSGPLQDEDAINTKTYTTTTKVGDHVVTDNVGNTQTCHPNVYVDKTPPYISYAQYNSRQFYESYCPSNGISYTWTDDESGFASGTVNTYYKGSLMVSNLATDSNPKVGLWSRSDKSDVCDLGSYKFELQATDNVGNISSVYTYNYTVVEDPPPPPPPTIELTTNLPGCKAGRFTSKEQNKMNCDSGYYLPIYEDTCRTPAYGCAASEDAGTISITASGYSNADRARKLARNRAIQALQTDMYGTGNYMYENGETGSMYLWYNCTGGDSISCTSFSQSSYPIAYIIPAESSCSVSSSNGFTYSATCTIKKKRCTQYNNGSQYWSHVSSNYQFWCCANSSSDSQCKRTSS